MSYMDNCLISKGLRRSQHTLSNIISFKNINRQILDEILCMDNFREGDLKLFDDFIYNKDFKDIIEHIFECFLKIAGIEPALTELLGRNNIFEKLMNISSGTAGGALLPSNLATYKERPFEEYKLFEVAKSVLSSAFDDSKVYILAYLVCIDKNTCYKGDYEAFYIIDYLVKGHGSVAQVQDGTEAHGEDRQTSPEGQEATDKLNDILLNWAKNCSVSFNSSLLLFDSAGFFESEILYLRDFKLLCEIIVARKSHRILLSRLHFIIQSLSRQGCNIDNLGVCVGKSCVAGPLEDLLVLSYSNDNACTNEILLKLSNETLTKNFIIRAGASLPSFFEVCRKIDPLYIECMNLCIEHFGIAHGDTDGLWRVCKSEYFRVDSFQGFKRVVRILKERGLPIPVEKLCSTAGPRGDRADNSHEIAALVGNLEIGTTNGIEKASLKLSRNGRKEFINRVVYLLHDSAVVPLRILKKCITKKHPRLSTIVMLRSKSFRLFKHGYLKLKNLSEFNTNDEPSNQSKQLATGPSSDTVKMETSAEISKKVSKKPGQVGTAINANLFNELIVEELKRLDYSKFYQKVIAFLLSNKIIRDLSFAGSSPFALALLSKFKTEAFGTSEVGRGLAAGLYFYKSHLKLSKLYKKFIFRCEITIYREYLVDMPVLRFGEDISVNICRGEIICNNGEESRTMLRLGECTIFNGTVPADHVTPTDAGMPSRDGKRYLSSFGMVYGSEIGPGRFSVTDVRSSRALSEKIEIQISAAFDRGSIEISLNKGEIQKFATNELQFIEIGERFYGVIRNLLYAETNEIKPQTIKTNSGKPDMDVFYDECINPIEKLLRYKGRKGVFIDTLKPFYLSSSTGFLRMENIIEYRSIEDIEFHN